MNLRIFIGYDRRQPLAFQVLAHSIWAHASQPVSILRLDLSHLPMTRRGLTEFTYSRFLIPYLCDYEGYGLFLDSDILCRSDVTELFQVILDDPAHDETAVWVSKNVLRFEWASVMVFQNALCRQLTPRFLEQPDYNPLSLTWATRVGDLSRQWNHLVGYDAPDPDAKLVHFTCGIPCWPETAHHEYGQEWRTVAKQSVSTVSFEELMGQSVHATRVKELLQVDRVTPCQA